MSSSLYPCNKERIIGLARQCGACAVGVANAAPVDPAVAAAFDAWLAAGNAASMKFMYRWRDIRLDPRLLLPGAASVISMAFPYRPAGGYSHPLIADYALGEDYHRVIPRRLSSLISFLSSLGAFSRICVDSAPILERYWAVKAGVGFIGRNRQLIVPGVGSGVFLAEIVTTLLLQPDSPCTLSCDGCNRCVKACPAGAISSGTTFDARRCMSYLTIEDPDGYTVPSGAKVYGCDICARVCPHNAQEPPQPLSEFMPDPRLLTLDRLTLSQITAGDFKRLFRDKSVSRVKAAKIRKNAKINKF
ncbi:MAG: tRNA epoxyqueuosine(34) reductase QueG [Muribaculaceae bacterium]|nr:tRNA epoxyqueuosine(34) reductase QueG [Muribaculaceae bacterium]